MLIDYTRVSTAEKNAHIQSDPLKSAGCGKIVADHASGVSAGREGLSAALSHLRSEAEFVVWKLDRLGRTVRQLVQLVEQLQQRGVGFRSLTDHIETSTPAGRFFSHVMAALAEMERDLIRERTMAGLSAARTHGRRGSRKPKLSQPQLSHALRLLKDPEVMVTAVANSFGVSRTTLYRALDVPRR